LIKKFTDKHEALVDLDGDGFSTIPTFRGYNWRGHDCDDFSKAVKPGRRVWKGADKSKDYNCNGISGINAQTGRPNKELYCDNSGQIGVVVIGDSAGAHFSIPERYMNASMINKTSYGDLFSVVSNELDWPHMSGYTGFGPDSSDVPLRSIYKKLVERNRCNQNDYQNVAVNGGESGNTIDNMKALSRD